MDDTTLTLDQIFENAGLVAKWEARGEARGEANKALDIAQNMVNSGFPLETIVSITELDPEKVKTLFPQGK